MSEFEIEQAVAAGIDRDAAIEAIKAQAEQERGGISIFRTAGQLREFLSTMHDDARLRIAIPTDEIDDLIGGCDWADEIEVTVDLYSSPHGTVSFS
jgi:hypothetical protein